MPEKRQQDNFFVDLALLGLFDFIIGLMLNFVFLLPFWFGLPLGISLLMFLLFYNFRVFNIIFNEPPMYGTLVRWS